jgi:hypothetical protein
MKTEFSEYFKSIGITEPVLTRIETIMEYSSQVCPNDEVMDVFVSEYVEQDGTRKYEDLRLFCKKRHFVASDFINKDEFYVTDPLAKIIGIKFEAKDFDFKKATDKSRLRIRRFYSYESLSEFKASMQNCDHLMRIYEKYILPYLMFE